MEEVTHDISDDIGKGDESDTLVPDEPVLQRSSRIRKKTGEWCKAQPGSKNSKDGQPYETALVVDEKVLCSYTEAMSLENMDFWTPAIEKEHNSIRENNTFSIIPRQKGMSVIPCKYVFKLKNGVPKVRIVAKGYRQKLGINYFETYFPVVSFTTPRCFLSYVAHLNLECDQMDVVTAFLNGELEETIHMEIPAGFAEETIGEMVCLLHKALYGLKQAPRQWYAKINSFLVNDLQFKRCSYEPCLYIRHREKEVMLIVLYVDDILIAGNDRAVVDDVKLEFTRKYKMKDLGAAQEFLRIEITRERSNYRLYSLKQRMRQRF